MYIKTADGWRMIDCKSIPAPIEPAKHNLMGYAERGYKSYVGWIHNDYDLTDPTQEW